MIYKILSYNDADNTFNCHDESGKCIRLDLFTDASYKGFGNLKKLTTKKCRSFIGKKIEVKELSPYIPCLFAQDVILLK